MRVSSGWLLLFCLIPAAAAAQGSFSLPLPSPDLPAGVLTVKVVGSGMEDRRVGQEVTLLQVERSGEAKLIETVKTGDDARARFEKLQGGLRYQVRAEIDGQTMTSEILEGPTQGGVRLLLTLSGSGMPGMSSGSEGPASMPAGHPPTGPGMPGGHPATGAAGGSGAATIKAVKELAPGQLLVRVVKGKPPRPVPEVMVLGAGEKDAHPKTDAEGKLLISIAEEKRAAGLPGLTVVHDGISYRSDAVQIPKEGGLEVTFTVYDRSRNLKALSIAPGSHLVLQPGEGALSVMQVLHIENSGGDLIEFEREGLALPLPRGARSAEVAAEQKELMAVDEEQAQVRIVNPLPPGRTMLRIFFEIPHQSGELDFRQKLPISSSETLAVVSGSRPLSLAGPSVRGTDGDNKDRFVLVAVPAGGEIEFTVSGLAHRDRRPALIAIGLAGLLLLWGMVAAWLGPRRAREREEKQEQLLQQLLKLQRSKRRTEATAQRRKELIKELSGIWEEPQQP